MECLLKSCIRCGGDLVLDDSDWKCVQCARYLYTDRKDILPDFSPTILPKLETLQAKEDSEFGSVFTSTFYDAPELIARKSPRRRRSNYGSRAARNINSYIHAKSRGEDRWWDRNKQVVEYLDQGLSVQEIAGLTERGPRQIRTIRERLTDLRAAA